MVLPLEIQQAVDQAVDHIRSHPKHEFGQKQRGKIYELLRLTSHGDNARKWLAFMSAQRVVPIYVEAVSRLGEYGDDEVHIPERMLDLAEQILTGKITIKYVSENYSYILYYMNIGRDKRVPYLALAVALRALEEVMGTLPFEAKIGGEVMGEDGTLQNSGSDTWSDERLAGAGCHAGDAAVDAAYAFAESNTPGTYDFAKVREFWEWWLNEALPQAWLKANDNDQLMKAGRA